MASTLAGKISLLVNMAYGDATVSAINKQATTSIAPAFNFTNGVAINQVNAIYAETRTLGASATVTLDLSSLTDIFGAALAFVRVKAILISPVLANVNNVLMGAAAGTQFLGPLGSATDVLNVRPGGLAALIAPDATGWAVGAGVSLKFANSAGTSGVTFDLIILGGKS